MILELNRSSSSSTTRILFYSLIVFNMGCNIFLASTVWTDHPSYRYLCAGMLIAEALMTIAILVRVVKPMRNLHKVIAAMSKGNLTVRAKAYHRDEFGELAKAFNSMADQIADRSVALEQSEQRFRRLSEAAAEGIAIIESGVITEANDALARMFGYETQEMIGRSPLDFVAKESIPAVSDAMSSRMDAITELVAITKSCERFIVEIQAKTVYHFGNLQRVAIVRDVTEQRALERMLQNQCEELQQLDRLKNDFVNAVSHELRTPLTSIMGYSEFLEDELGGCLSDQQKAFVGQIQEGTNRLLRIVDDLLDFARLEAGTFKLAKQPADIHGLVRDEASSLIPNAMDAGVELLIHVPSDPQPVMMDYGRIGQVVINLVNNAIKFTPKGGKVTVSTQRSQDKVTISVRDTGIGIPSDLQDRLFSKFFQVDPSATREKGGAGLGLSISKALIEAHGGEIGVVSKEGDGSTFWFTLPVGPITNGHH